MDLQIHYYFLGLQPEPVTFDLLNHSCNGDLAKEKAIVSTPKKERSLLRVLNYKFSKFARLMKKGDRSASSTQMMHCHTLKRAAPITAVPLPVSFKKYKVLLYLVKQLIPNDADFHKMDKPFTDACCGLCLNGRYQLCH